MFAAEDCALVLLAAGLSRRFGATDKLMADLGGRPLGLHVAEALAGVPFGSRIAVTGAGSPEYAPLGFRIVLNAEPAHGQAGSLRLGVDAARSVGAGAVLVLLADMPRVGAGHVRGLLAAASGGEAAIACSTDGVRRSPPALFGRGWFGRLAALSGDEGARALLADAPAVRAAPGELVDVDTPAALAALRRN
jgi:molybdenum cofactor cytidylyltransferase